MIYVIVMQGLPGSGKTRFAKHYPHRVPSVVFSADDYHIYNGLYQFNPRKSEEAHADCFRRFLEHIQAHETDDLDQLVIVDNTNCRAHEIAPYMSVAAAYDCDAEIVYCPCSVETSVARNEHGVPFATIWHMHAALMTESFPTYWPRRLLTEGV